MNAVAAELRKWRVSLKLVTMVVEVEAADEDAARDEAIASFEQIHEVDRERDNLTVEVVS